MDRQTFKQTAAAIHAANYATVRHDAAIDCRNSATRIIPLQMRHKTVSETPHDTSSRHAQHFGRMLERGIGNFDAAQHARNFLDALLAVLSTAIWLSVTPSARRLAHLPLRVRRRRHLRQMGDAHHLIMLAQLA